VPAWRFVAKILFLHHTITGVAPVPRVWTTGRPSRSPSWAPSRSPPIQPMVSSDAQGHPHHLNHSPSLGLTADLTRRPSAALDALVVHHERSACGSSYRRRIASRKRRPRSPWTGSTPRLSQRGEESTCLPWRRRLRHPRSFDSGRPAVQRHALHPDAVAQPYLFLAAPTSRRRCLVADPCSTTSIPHRQAVRGETSTLYPDDAVPGLGAFSCGTTRPAGGFDHDWTTGSAALEGSELPRDDTKLPRRELRPGRYPSREAVGRRIPYCMLAPPPYRTGIT